MFLKSLTLSHFKCFESLHLAFDQEDGTSRQWTVLLGENGTGKTNLLRAVTLLTAGSDALPDLLGEPDHWIQYGKESCKLSAELMDAEGEPQCISLEIHRGDSRTDVALKNRSSLAVLDQALEQTKQNYFVVGYGASRHLNDQRSVRPKSSRFTEVRAESVATLFDPDASLNLLESWAMDLDYRRGEGLQVIRETLDQFLRGVKFHGIDKEKGDLLFETADGIMPLALMSDGYQNVAAWVGDLLYRITSSFEDDHSPWNAKGLLLIDEIGLHLHPKWQRELVDFIGAKLPNFQLIVTTHSPLTAQQAGEGELYYFFRDNGHVDCRLFHGAPKHLALHQLVTAEAFGLKTDESYEIENKKARYRQLRDTDGLSGDERSEFESLSQELADLPKTYRTPLASDRQVRLLERIEEELVRGKS